MQISFIVFFYILSFLLFIPLVILGNLLKPSKNTKQDKMVTPKDILKNLSKNQDLFQKGLEDFENFFLSSNSCDQKTWLKMIGQITSSKWLDFAGVVSLQEKLNNANPQFLQEIQATIDTSLKNKK